MLASAELTRTKQLRKGTFWQEWGILTAAGIAAVLAGLPGLWPALEQSAEKMGNSMPTLLIFQLAASAVQIAVIVAVGLFFAQRVGLGAPLLEQWLNHERIDTGRSVLVSVIALGVLGAVAVIALDRLVFAPQLPGFSSLISQVSGWQGFLASFYGGILEELELRLLAVSACVWLLGKLSSTAEGTPNRWVFWSSIVIVAILFGLGHLPVTSLSVAITPFVILRAVLLNGILGMLYGLLYWKRGLEAAMLGHFSSDIVVHVLLPLI